jgi:hypothetical protein
MASVNEQAVQECVTAIKADIAKGLVYLEPAEVNEVLDRLSIELEDFKQEEDENDEEDE